MKHIVVLCMKYRVKLASRSNIGLNMFAMPHIEGKINHRNWFKIVVV